MEHVKSGAIAVQFPRRGPSVRRAVARRCALSRPAAIARGPARTKKKRAEDRGRCGAQGGGGNLSRFWLVVIGASGAGLPLARPVSPLRNPHRIPKLSGDRTVRNFGVDGANLSPPRAAPTRRTGRRARSLARP
ncbi:MAG: hypothetical protein ACOY5V_09720 [Pseudomonadota bacterium]